MYTIYSIVFWAVFTLIIISTLLGGKFPYSNLFLLFMYVISFIIFNIALQMPVFLKYLDKKTIEYEHHKKEIETENLDSELKKISIAFESISMNQDNIFSLQSAINDIRNLLKKKLKEEEITYTKFKNITDQILQNDSPKR
jgi:hypothetical protein